MKRITLHRATGVAASALALVLAAPAVAQDLPTQIDDDAQTAPEADAYVGADIIVTAQRREERLQDVPLAVTVLSGERLAEQGGVNLETAQLIIPTLNIQRSGTTINQSLYMRGVGTATFSIAGEPSVSTVVDGVVLQRSGEAFSELVDIDRLEVLRGPQGTLFGKNASAGVINIVTRRPGDDFGGTVDLGFFTRDEFRGRVALDIPLGANVRSRVTGFYSEYGGNIRNLTLDRRVNGYQRYGVRGIIVADPTPDVQLTLIADWRKSDDDCCAQLIGTVPTNLAAQVLPTPRGDETREITQNLLTRTLEESWGVSLQADASFGDHTLTSITAYRNWENREIRDGDFLPQAFIGLPQLHDDGPQVSETFSQELRLTSPAGQTLEYIAGAYYSNAPSDRTFTRNSVLCNALAAPAPATPTPCTSPLAAASRNPVGVATFGATFETFAVYGNATLNLTERFRLLGGLRYTYDELSVYHQRVSTGLDRNAAGAFVNTGGINPSFGPFRSKTSENNLSGRAGLQFDLADSSTAYATYSRGYKGPAFNIFFNLGATGTNVIEAETADAFEIGLKNTLFGGALVLNLAAFYAKYDNFQADNPDLITGNPPTVVGRFTNAGEVSTRGFEADLIARPVRGLSLFGGLAYTDAKVDEFNAPPGANPADIIPSGTPLRFAPEWKGSLGIDYETPLTGALNLYLGAQGSYQTEQLSIFSPSATTRALGTIDDYGIINLSAGFGDAADRYRVTFQVRNLLDQSFVTQKEGGGPGGSIRIQVPRDADRYFGVVGRVNF